MCLFLRVCVRGAGGGGTISEQEWQAATEMERTALCAGRHGAVLNKSAGVAAKCE